MRDDFKNTVKEELAKRVAYLCSNPLCRQSTSGPQSTQFGIVNIGVAAHITAASSGGPRYDSSLTSQERCSSSNGIWLCQTCAKLVDNDPLRYTVKKLREWKAEAEAAAARSLEQRRLLIKETERIFIEAEQVMPNLIVEMRKDICGDKTKLIREFVLLPDHEVIFGHTKPRFIYYENEHPNLQLQLDWLEEMGIIVNVTKKNTPVYKMSTEFISWLREST